MADPAPAPLAEPSNKSQIKYATSDSSSGDFGNIIGKNALCIVCVNKLPELGPFLRHSSNLHAFLDCNRYQQQRITGEHRHRSVRGFQAQRPYPPRGYSARGGAPSASPSGSQSGSQSGSTCELLLRGHNLSTGQRNLIPERAHTRHRCGRAVQLQSVAHCSTALHAYAKIKRVLTVGHVRNPMQTLHGSTDGDGMPYCFIRVHCAHNVMQGYGSAPSSGPRS